jgi:hypothetical protein
MVAANLGLLHEFRDYYAGSREAYLYRPPMQRDDGWQTGSLVGSGIDTLAGLALKPGILGA